MIILVLCIIIFTRAAVYNFNDTLKPEDIVPDTPSEGETEPASLMVRYCA